MTVTTHVLRSARAESIRTGGRGPLWTILIPAACLVPAVITFTIAVVAEYFARIPGQTYVQQVATSNATYWVVTVTVVMAATAAAYGRSSESQWGAGAFVKAALPRTWTADTGKWLFYGLLGAFVAAVMVAVVLIALPMVSPLVYGEVSIADPVGRRLLVTVPILAFFAAGFGIGVGAITRSPAAAVGAVLLWVYVIETAVGYLPGGISTQRFMPFLNGVYGTGQDIILAPPWGPDVGLAYACAVFAIMFAGGLCAARLKRGVTS
jgi:ABC-2 type transport system permease protein